LLFQTKKNRPAIQLAAKKQREAMDASFAFVPFTHKLHQKTTYEISIIS